MKVLEIRNLVKSFGKVEAVRGITLEILSGECVGLLGPNGAGKSTLIHMLYGTCLRTSGEIRVFGRDPSSDSREIKRQVGVVTQDNALDESLTVEENLLLYAAYVNVPKAERCKRIHGLLDSFSLAQRKADRIQSLSGGLKRRLVFVRALLSDPKLLILDEPTTGLDPAVRHLLWGQLRDLHDKGKTILLTTHYMHEAEMLCDRIFVINKGKVIAEGPPRHLIDRLTPGFVATFDRSVSAGALEKSATDKKLVFQNHRSGMTVRAEKWEDLLSIQSSVGREAMVLRPSNLEDVFLHLTGQELGENA